MFGFDEKKCIPEDALGAIKMLYCTTNATRIICPKCDVLATDESEEPDNEELRHNIMRKKYDKIYKKLRSYDRKLIASDEFDFDAIDYHKAFSDDDYFRFFMPVLFELYTNGKIRLNVSEFHYGYMHGKNILSTAGSILSSEKKKHYIVYKYTCKKCGHEWYSDYILDPRYHDYNRKIDLSQYHSVDLFFKLFDKEES